MIVIKAYHSITTALIKDFTRILEKSVLEVFDDRSGNTVSSIFGGPIRSYLDTISNSRRINTSNIHNHYHNFAKSSSESSTSTSDEFISPLTPFNSINDDEIVSDLPNELNTQNKTEVSSNEMNDFWFKKRDSLIVESFAEDAIRLELEQIQLRAQNRNGDLKKGFNRELFTSLSLEEPNIVNAVFDSIVCLY